MKKPRTKIVRVDQDFPEYEHLQAAADIVAHGGLVIIPTETVYGIAADANNMKAVERLYAIKQRPKDKPFSVHIDCKDKIEEYAKEIPRAAYKLIDKFWPGPLTLILKSATGNETVGVRLPDNIVAQRVIALSRVKVICPSANLSGALPPVEASQALRDLEGLVDFAIDAGKTKYAGESSIVDLSVEPFTVQREGVIKKEAIETQIQKKTVLFVCTGNSCRSVMAEGLLKKVMQEKKRKNVEVSSAGIAMIAGLGASEETRSLLAQQGIDMSEHVSRRVTRELLYKSDLILVMERLHETKLLQMAPEVKQRLFLLKEFAKVPDNHLDIIDPIGKTMEFYEETFLIIKEAIGKIAEII